MLPVFVPARLRTDFATLRFYCPQDGNPVKPACNLLHY